MQRAKKNEDIRENSKNSNSRENMEKCCSTAEAGICSHSTKYHSKRFRYFIYFGAYVIYYCIFHVFTFFVNAVYCNDFKWPTGECLLLRANKILITENRVYGDFENFQCLRRNKHQHDLFLRSDTNSSNTEMFLIFLLYAAGEYKHSLVLTYSFLRSYINSRKTKAVLMLVDAFCINRNRKSRNPLRNY